MQESKYSSFLSILDKIIMSDSECDVEEEYNSFILKNKLNSSTQFHNKLSLSEKKIGKSRSFSMNVEKPSIDSQINIIER